LFAKIQAMSKTLDIEASLSLSLNKKEIINSSLGKKDGGNSG